MTVGKFLKNAGHSVSQGSKSIGHVFSSGEKKIEGAVSDVYHDGKGAVGQVYKDSRTAVSYSGKHLINDVDTLTNAVSSPMLWIVVGVVAIAFLNNRR